MDYFHTISALHHKLLDYFINVISISYEYEMLWIRFIGTHAEYDKINASTI